MKTIFALSSGRVAAGVAVLRVSGPQTREVIRALTEDRSARILAAPREAVLATLWGAEPREALDRALVLWFPAPGSFTGEDLAEFHVHGGLSVIDAVASAIAAVPDCRPAEAGEFTKRAFEHGRLDLTQAEGIADLISAETAAQRRQALAQAEGGLAADLAAWREGLLGALAHLEATIDFAEEDLPEGVDVRVRGELAEIAGTMEERLRDAPRGERLRSGVKVAILGPPNAGKSSFLNMLAKRDAAIVSEIAGTTRDVIEVHMDFGGYPVTFGDTAGIRETGDVIEQEGVRRARAWAAAADLTVWMCACGDLSWPEERGDDVLLVANKADRGGAFADSAKAKGFLPVSVSTGGGIEGLLHKIEGHVGRLLGEAAAPPLTRARHRSAIEEAAGCLRSALEVWSGEGECAVVAEDVRLALRAVGRVTGVVDVEDLLDVVFRDFCIGK